MTTPAEYCAQLGITLEDFDRWTVAVAGGSPESVQPYHQGAVYRLCQVLSEEGRLLVSPLLIASDPGQ